MELIGVYHADGGVAGELRYVAAKLLGRTHCGLCDITHAVLRRKREWDELVADLESPFRLLHLNEMPADVAEAVALSGSPVVLGQEPSGELRVLLTPAALDSVQGSVPAFAEALRTALATGSN